jgi:hypothetical protein
MRKRHFEKLVLIERPAKRHTRNCYAVPAHHHHDRLLRFYLLGSSRSTSLNRTTAPSGVQVSAAMHCDTMQLHEGWRPMLKALPWLYPS